MLSLPLNMTDVTPRPARLVTITREDGTVIRIAEARTPVIIAGNTWSPLPGFNLSAVKNAVGGEAASVQLDLVMTVGGTINTYHVVDQKFDNASVQVDVIDRANPTTRGFLFSGRIGPTVFGALHNTVTFEVRGHATKALWPFVGTFGPMCRTDLASILCRVPLLPPIVARNTAYVTKASENGYNNVYGRMLTGTSTPDGYQNVYFECTTAGTTANSAPSYNFTVGATTTDGSAVFTARNAWTRHAKVLTVLNQFNVVLDRDPDPRAVTGWFNQGGMRMFDGYSAARAFEIGAWTSSSRTITLYLPLGAANNDTLIHAGDWLELWRGCDFTIATCANVFGNSLNFRGEPYFAGAAAAATQQQ
jgi:hypothetical protein